MCVYESVCEKETRAREETRVKEKNFCVIFIRRNFSKKKTMPVCCQNACLRSRKKKGKTEPTSERRGAVFCCLLFEKKY